MNTILLSNGIEMPCLGYGTGVVNFPSKRQKLKDAKRDLLEIQLLSQLLDIGVSLIDTSDSYDKSQWHIGRVIKKQRNRFFICSKISNKAQYNDTVRECFYKMLEQLNTDYIDLLLLHWPVTDYFLKSWKVLESLYKEKRVNAIGVANCNIHHLEDILETCSIQPMVNQIECHPLFTQDLLREYCKKNNIQIMAYTPTGRMDNRLNISCVKTIAEKHKKSMAQVILRWHYQLGNIPVINTSKKNHLVDNVKIFDFELSEKEVKAILSSNINSRLRYDADNCDFTKL